jgi:hypothetical protein
MRERKNSSSLHESIFDHISITKQNKGAIHYTEVL